MRGEVPDWCVVRRYEQAVVFLLLRLGVRRGPASADPVEPVEVVSASGF
jgi:hypothetical protein